MLPPRIRTVRDMAESVARITGYPEDEAEALINLIFGDICAAVAGGDKVHSLGSLGTLCVVDEPDDNAGKTAILLPGDALLKGIEQAQREGWQLRL
jgi:hypothetical protein